MLWATNYDVYEEQDILVQVAHIVPVGGWHHQDRDGSCWCHPKKELKVWPWVYTFRKTVLYIHLNEGKLGADHEGRG